MLGVEAIIFQGARMALSELYKRLKSKGKYLVVIANRESILNDAKEFFKDHKVLFSIVEERFSLEQEDIERLVNTIDSVINNNTKPRDTVIFVLAAPCIFYAFLADKFHHSSRHILFAQFDLKEKVYRIYKVSSH